jgi:hypothetical protein
MSTIAEQWTKEAEARGEAGGRAGLFLQLLERRFGPLPQAYRDRIDQADPDTLVIWADRMFTAQSLEEVFAEHP